MKASLSENMIIEHGRKDPENSEEGAEGGGGWGGGWWATIAVKDIVYWLKNS